MTIFDCVSCCSALFPPCSRLLHNHFFLRPLAESASNLASLWQVEHGKRERKRKRENFLPWGGFVADLWIILGSSGFAIELFSYQPRTAGQTAGLEVSTSSSSSSTSPTPRRIKEKLKENDHWNKAVTWCRVFNHILFPISLWYSRDVDNDRDRPSKSYRKRIIFVNRYYLFSSSTRYSLYEF